MPGHEVVCRIVAVGEQVKKHKVGERCLVQTDYRQLPTAAGSNAAFGYNFDGGLQEYTLLDERVVIAPNGERFLIPVGEERGASAIALVEPWACVEDSYVTVERNRIKANGRLAIVVADGREANGVKESYSPSGEPAEVRTLSPSRSGRVCPTNRLTTSFTSAPTGRRSRFSTTNSHRAASSIWCSVASGSASWCRSAWAAFTMAERAGSAPRATTPPNRIATFHATARSAHTIACSWSVPAGRWDRCTSFATFA